MKKIIVFFIVLLPLIGFSQIEVLSNDATKYYPDGTRISYLTLSDYPVESDFINSVNSDVVKDHKIIRFYLNKDGHSCFVESKDDFSDDLLIIAINEAYQSYYSRPTRASETPENVYSAYSKSSVSSRENSQTIIVKENPSVRSFTKKSEGRDGKYVVAFKLEDESEIDNVNNAIILLKELGNFDMVSVMDNVYIELSSVEPINADFVIGIFEEFGLSIEDEFIK